MKQYKPAEDEIGKALSYQYNVATESGEAAKAVASWRYMQAPKDLLHSLVSANMVPLTFRSEQGSGVMQTFRQMRVSKHPTTAITRNKILMNLEANWKKPNQTLTCQRGQKHAIQVSLFGTNFKQFSDLIVINKKTSQISNFMVNSTLSL
jgi:hypothetical protein